MNRKTSLLMLTAFIIFSGINAEGENMQNKHTVVVILESKSEKNEELKNELLKVKKLSEQEPACIEYHIFQDIDNPNKIILYENWTSKEEHAKQFKKPYILEFGNKLQDLLARPYEGMMAKEIN